ncbi:MAG TPA: endolytic transglycosylase MltG [Candidatus Cloacimonetes bacterium]|nr:endolytic transglycosylase MltG [Candidatus Cloacimonadota bacterium]HEX37372.1 endolytic transglycosylase MltG [Candidatus Cloacimonadota bacterium]
MTPKKFITFLLIFVFLFFLFYTIASLHKPYPIANKTIVIEKGTSAQYIAKELQRKQIIPSATLFLVVEKFLPSDRQLRYGKFNFAGWFSFMDVMHKLTSGEVVTNRITIPEGYTIRRIASLLSKKELVDYSKFMSLCVDSVFIDSLGLGIHNLEGFLFPDTYYIPYFADERFIVKMMVDNFFMQWNIIQPKAIAFDSLYKIVILASIVEREAIYDDERPLIAGVYTKRLKENMLLQADPTVAYALELNRISRSNISYEDLKINSVYNTYRYRGLPPTPICNPGIQSLIAALHPQETDYLFFFAGKDKRHIFSKTYREHLKKLNRI